MDERTIARWTDAKREEMDKERKRKGLELYLRAWNTTRSIARELNVDHKTVLNDLRDLGKNGEISETPQTFKPYLYNIWNLQKQDNAVDRFGQFPQVFMETLLYYHTKPLDIVYDPFVGG